MTSTALKMDMLCLKTYHRSMMFNDIHIWIGTYIIRKMMMLHLIFVPPFFVDRSQFITFRIDLSPGQAAQSLPLTQVRWNSFYSSSGFGVNPFEVSEFYHIRRIREKHWVQYFSFWLLDRLLLPYGGLLKWGGTSKSSFFFSAFPWKKPSSYWATPSLGNLYHLVI